MKKLIIILMVGSLFAEEPMVTILGKSGIYVTGTIKKYENGKIIIDSKKVIIQKSQHDYYLN